MTAVTRCSDANFRKSVDCRKLGLWNQKCSHGNDPSKTISVAFFLLLRSWCFQDSMGKTSSFDNLSFLSEVTFSTPQNLGIDFWELLNYHTPLFHLLSAFFKLDPTPSSTKMSEHVKVIPFPCSRATLRAARWDHLESAPEIRHHWDWIISVTARKVARLLGHAVTMTRSLNVFSSSFGMTFSWRRLRSNRVNRQSPRRAWRWSVCLTSEQTFLWTIVTKNCRTADWQLTAQEETKRKGQDVYRMPTSGRSLDGHDGLAEPLEPPIQTEIWMIVLDEIHSFMESTLKIESCVFWQFFSLCETQTETTSTTHWNPLLQVVPLFFFPRVHDWASESWIRFLQESSFFPISSFKINSYHVYLTSHESRPARSKSGRTQKCALDVHNCQKLQGWDPPIDKRSVFRQSWDTLKSWDVSSCLGEIQSHSLPTIRVQKWAWRTWHWKCRPDLRQMEGYTRGHEWICTAKLTRPRTREDRHGETLRTEWPPTRGVKTSSISKTRRTSTRDMEHSKGGPRDLGTELFVARKCQWSQWALLGWNPL